MSIGRLIFIAGLAAACTRTEPDAGETPAATAAVDTARPWRQPGDKIDSILPMPEYLRRFREGLTEPATFSGGEASRDALALRFLSAVSARDSASLGSLVISRAEFAWLVFPHHIYASPPYELDPAIFWMQLTAGSAKGAHRILDRLGGKALTFQALDCRRDTLQVKRGPIRVWSSCGVRYREGDRVLTRRLFGSIVELDGRVKLMSFANDF
jgi:hypothetical protein